MYFDTNTRRLLVFNAIKQAVELIPRVLEHVEEQDLSEDIITIAILKNDSLIAKTMANEKHEALT